VRPELVVEVKYLSWTDDNLLRQVIYQGLRGTSRPLRSAVQCRTRSPPRRKVGVFPRRSVDPVLEREIRSRNDLCA
jgi:hypothetical protein